MNEILDFLQAQFDAIYYSVADSTTFVTTSQQQAVEDFKKLPGRACDGGDTKDMFKSRDEALKRCTPDICGSVWVYSPECNPEKRAYCCDAHSDKYLYGAKGHCVYKKIQNNSCWICVVWSCSIV